MTIPFLCVFMMYLLILATKGPVGFAQWRAEGGYDNSSPREQQAALEGWARRAVGAHNNTLEAFPVFAAAVMVAHLGGANTQHAALASVTFIAARTMYPVLYILDIQLGRSIIWTFGYVVCGALMLLPLFA